MTTLASNSKKDPYVSAPDRIDRFPPCTSFTQRYDVSAQLFDEFCEFSDCAVADGKALPDLVSRVAAPVDVVLVDNPLLMREQMPLLKIDLKLLQRSITT
jgi:hypothetical protein